MANEKLRHAAVGQKRVVLGVKKTVNPLQETPTVTTTETPIPTATPRVMSPFAPRRLSNAVLGSRG